MLGDGHFKLLLNISIWESYRKKIRKNSKSVVMISSELPEVIGMSDRIYIMNQAKIVGEMKASEATQESIMACIVGVRGEQKNADNKGSEAK